MLKKQSTPQSDSPKEIRFSRKGATAQKLKEMFTDTVTQIREAQLPMVASSLAYTTILSIVPLLALSFAIFQAFGGMEKLYQTIEPFIIENLAEGADAEAMDFIRKFIGNIHAGPIGAGGLIGLLFTSMSMLFSIEKAINRVWKAENTRSFFTRLTSYWFFITLGPLAMAVGIGAATSAAAESNISITRFLPSGTGIYLIVTAVFFAMYKWVPNRKVSWKPAFVSAAVAAGAWNIARWGYALYTKKAVSYSKIYGSLGAIPILILWIYIVWLIVLAGAALTASLQKRLDLK